MGPTEFHQRWESNAELLQKSNDKLIRAVIIDTQGKKHWALRKQGKN